jgi:hypothetical protein
VFGENLSIGSRPRPNQDGNGLAALAAWLRADFLAVFVIHKLKGYAR